VKKDGIEYRDEYAGVGTEHLLMYRTGSDVASWTGEYY
jgi:hypothetical protein